MWTRQETVNKKSLKETKRNAYFHHVKGQIHVAVVMNNYLNDWAFNEKIDCIKASFCWKSIRGNHFSTLLTYCFFINSYSKDAWFQGFPLLGLWPLWKTPAASRRPSGQPLKNTGWSWSNQKRILHIFYVDLMPWNKIPVIQNADWLQGFQKT